MAQGTPKSPGLGQLGRAVGTVVHAAGNSLKKGAHLLHFPRLNLRRPAPGTAPGITLDDLGKLAAGTAPVYLSVIDYCADWVQRREIAPGDFEAFLAQHRPEGTTVRWINVDGLTDPLVIKGLAQKYGLHPLAIEDVMHLGQRPKIDPFASNDPQHARLFIIVPMVQLNGHGITREQISIFLGHGTVLTFQETHGDVWDPIRKRIDTPNSRLRQSEASFLLYALIDAMVDYCYPVLETYSQRLEEIEARVMSHADPAVVQEIFNLKRELMLLERQIWPTREVINHLQRETHDCLSAQTKLYLRDVQDHCVQILEILETYRELASSLADTFHTLVGNRMNEVMKVLTVFASIFIPITFFAGVYGMNFDYMPELHWRYGYHLFWACCAGLTVGMLWYFRRNRWI